MIYKKSTIPIVNFPRVKVLPLNQLYEVFWRKKDHSVHVSVYNPVKRLIDIIGAIVGLMLTGIIFIPLAIAIWWDSPGPILYSQTRCGLKGKTFRIWKFRSMITDAEQKKHLVTNQAKGHIFKNDKDPRITRVGRFIRKTSLDEFPQFWNVFLGDMSLVGTRPPTPNEVKNYNERHMLRLKVKPGITGELKDVPLLMILKK